LSVNTIYTTISKYIDIHNLFRKEFLGEKERKKKGETVDNVQ